MHAKKIFGKSKVLKPDLFEDMRWDNINEPKMLCRLFFRYYVIDLQTFENFFTLDLQ